MFDHIQFLGHLDITVQVMAISDMSPGDQYAVKSAFQTIDDKNRIYPAGAHDSDGPYGGGILNSRYTGLVRTCIGAPVAEEGQDFWSKSMIHSLIPPLNWLSVFPLLHHSITPKKGNPVLFVKMFEPGCPNPIQESDRKDRRSAFHP